VVNPIYQKQTQQIEKENAEKAWLQAKIYAVIKEHLDENIDTIAQSLEKQAQITDRIRVTSTT